MNEQEAVPASKPAGAPAAQGSADNVGGFDGNSTAMFQAKMKRAPVWFCSFLAGNSREKLRLRDELALMKGAWPLLMKQRNGGKWTPEEKTQLKAMIRSASSVSPYLFIWALPGSVVLLPFLAWYLDRQRKSRARKQPRP
ncbi:MAG TPA: hypothetical protein VNN06_09830 [Ramlibacter sp.]|nr:hypothetical protein [Ramlibacter sp.]